MKISIKPTNKIFMGCDYYIDENLYIYYNDETEKCINLQRERCYYYHIRDECLENTTTYEKIKEYHLKPKSEPIVIYKNNTFITPEMYNKYKYTLEFEIMNDIKWNDIKEIVIVEKRIERE